MISYKLYALLFYKLDFLLRMKERETIMRGKLEITSEHLARHISTDNDTVECLIVNGGVCKPN